MGCDIHCHVEIKIDGTWHHYNMPRVDRSYGLFALMAGVRNGGRTPYVPVSEPKGLPADVSMLTKRDSDYWGIDGHSHSWLSTAEVKTLTERCVAAGIWKDKWGADDVFGYPDGNGWVGFIDYPQDRRKDAQDFRLVFWFDN